MTPWVELLLGIFMVLSAAALCWLFASAAAAVSVQRGVDEAARLTDEDRDAS